MSLGEFQRVYHSNQLRIWSHLLEKSLIEHFIFCADTKSISIEFSNNKIMWQTIEYFRETGKKSTKNYFGVNCLFSTSPTWQEGNAEHWIPFESHIGTWAETDSWKVLFGCIIVFRQNTHRSVVFFGISVSFFIKGRCNASMFQYR